MTHLTRPRGSMLKALLCLIAEKHAAEDLIIESAARADFMYGRKR